MFELLGLTFLLLLSGQVDAATCYYYRYGYYSSKSCTYGCCDSYSSDPCCSYSSSYYYYTYNSAYDLLKNTDVVSIGVIAGSVVGGIIGLALLITIIVCVCRACNRQNATLGQVITQPGTPYVTFTGASGLQQQYPNGGTANGGFMMGPIYPGYTMDNYSAAQPGHTLIQGKYPDQQLSSTVDNASPEQNYCSLSNDTDFCASQLYLFYPTV